MTTPPGDRLTEFAGGLAASRERMLVTSANWLAPLRQDALELGEACAEPSPEVAAVHARGGSGRGLAMSPLT